MSKLYLICDSVSNGPLEILPPLKTEASGSVSSNLRFRGKFQEADAKNKNGRIYSWNILNREMNRLQEAISKRSLIGELDHPSDSIIHFENASHVINKLWWEDKVMMGEGEILPTPSGIILKAIIESKIPIGISSRGVGSGKTNTDGCMIIDSNYKLITFDVVADPSTIGAYANTYESTKTESIKQKNTVKNESMCIHTIDSNIVIGWLKGAFEKYSKTN